MSAEQLTPTQSLPWEDREVSCLVQFGIVTLLVVDILVVIATFVMIIGALAATTSTSIASLVIAVLVFAGGVFVFFKWLWPLASRPTSFRPKVVYPPDNLGQNFEVKFMRARGRTYGGKGTARFYDKQLIIDGTLPPAVGTQLMVILCVTVIPLVLLGIGLGIIPALLLAYYIGRKQESTALYYPNLHLSVEGRTVSIDNQGYEPKNIKFRLATTDGERFYRELSQHYPQAVAQWQELLPPAATASQA